MTPPARLYLVTAILQAFSPIIFLASPGFCGDAAQEKLVAANNDDLATRGKAELEAAVKSLRPHESFDTTPVEFSIWNTHFRIPRNYLIVMENWSGGPQTDVTLRVTLPGLKPLTEKTRPCLVDKRFGEIAGCVPFEFRISGSGPSPDVVLLRIRKLYHNQEPLLHNQEPQAGKFGFDYYEWGSNGEIYRKTEGDEIFQYECAVFPRGSLNGECSHQGTRITPTTEINYFFAPSKLAVVVDLDKSLLLLARSFLVNSGENK